MRFFALVPGSLLLCEADRRLAPPVLIGTHRGRRTVEVHYTTNAFFTATDCEMFVEGEELRRGAEALQALLWCLSNGYTAAGHSERSLARLFRVRRSRRTCISGLRLRSGNFAELHQFVDSGAASRTERKHPVRLGERAEVPASSVFLRELPWKCPPLWTMSSRGAERRGICSCLPQHFHGPGVTPSALSDFGK
jgi:hypothetical protein